MFRTAIRTLSLFRKVGSGISNFGNTNVVSKYKIYKNSTFRNIEQPKLYNDTLNIFMLGAFLNESTKNTNNIDSIPNNNYKNDKNDKNYENDENHKKYNNYEEKKFKCQITGCEKRKNNVDCSCKDKCIVEKSELSIICDL